MKIRSKLSWTFILLLIVGITSICSYAILFIRDYMLNEGVKELQSDTRWLAVTVSNLPDTSTFNTHFEQVAKVSGYQIALYNSDGELLMHFPDSTAASSYLSDDSQIILKARNGLTWTPGNEHQSKLESYIYLPDSINKTAFIHVSQFKDRIYAPIKTIRWIIYYGMFISVGLVILVSILMARYITKPITQIKNTAQNIARGDMDQQIDLNRSDEFGTLATSLNQMATELREDTEQIKRYAEKQEQFFADITHEIRNPLHTLSASLEMMELESLPKEKRKQYHTNAKNQIDRISRLFKDLVTLQRYDSDSYFIETRTFNLAAIAAHMQEWHSARANKKGLELKIETHPCKALGDTAKIEQVIDNLVSNALKYTNEGAVSLHYFKKDNRVFVEVSDTGIGISREHLNRLFDRFYRTDKARSRDKGGTGLGLAVVHSILKAHGTEIEVESTPGQGSLFRFSLPVPPSVD